MKAILIVYAASLAYSAVRYLVFAPKNFENLPVFVVNKGWSMAAALCFVLGFFQQMRKSRRADGSVGGTEPALWFRAGLYGAIAHIPMSLAILRPEYFKEFFVDGGGKMVFNGEMVFLFGAVTAGGLYLLTRQDWTAMLRWRLSLITMLTLGTHVGFMGICRGVHLNKTHAYLPPMWLLSLIGIMLGIVWLLMSKPDSSQPDGQAWTAEKLDKH